MIVKNAMRRPSFWAGAYFLQIIFFAFVYLSMSNEFYHSTALNEPSLMRDERDIELILERIIYERIIGTDELDVAQLYVSIEYESQHRTKILVSNILGGGIANGELTLIQRRFDNDELFMDFDFRNFNSGAEVQHDEQGNVVNEFGQRVPTIIGEWGKFEIAPDEELLTLYKGWRAAHRGQPSRANGLFVRSLYLSVVTTTTLGYGDIVPLTSSTRAIVAVQTIVGVVISAVFLNFLLNGPRRRSRSD